MAKVERTQRLMTDRFQFDLRECRPRDGWAQLDTKQDADYYGNWVNPLTLELISYAEGDVTHTKCKDEDDFIQALRECIAWHKERDYFIGIDPLGNPDIQLALVGLNFGQFIH